MTDAEYGRLLTSAGNVVAAYGEATARGYVEGQTIPAYRANRNLLILLLLGETGVRVGELLGLEWADLVVGGAAVETLRVRAEIAKGGREREVPLSTVLRVRALAVWELIQGRPEAGNASMGYTQRSRVVALTPRAVQRVVGSLTLGVLGRWLHPHVFRHYAGNRWRRVADAYVVQRLLGHVRVETTVRYTQVSGDDLRAAVDGAAGLTSG